MLVKLLKTKLDQHFIKLTSESSKMTRNLNKTQYYCAKNIPIFHYCQKLEPQTPLRNHLLDTLPRLSSELQKILTHQRSQNITNLQLSNALKIIHELQDQMQLLASQKIQIEQQYFVMKAEKQQIVQELAKMKQRISQFQRNIQKTQFQTKNIYDKEVQKYNIVVMQYQRKLQWLVEENKKIRAEGEKDKIQMEKYYSDIIKQNERQSQQLQQFATKSNKKFQNDFGKVSSENIGFRQKILQLQLQNQHELQNLQVKLQSSYAQIKHLKQEYEHKLLTLQTNIKILEKQNYQLREQVSKTSQLMKENNEGWRKQKQKWMKDLQAEKDSLNSKCIQATQERDYRKKQAENSQRLLLDAQRQNQSLAFQIEKAKRKIVDFQQLLKQQKKQYEARLQTLNEKLKNDLYQTKKEALEENKHALQKQYRKLQQQLRRQNQEQRKKIKIQSLQKIQALEKAKCEIEHLLMLAKQSTNKFERKSMQLTFDNETLEQQMKEMKQYFDNRSNDQQQRSNKALHHQQEQFKKGIKNVRNQYQKQLDEIKDYYQLERKEFNKKQEQLKKQKRNLEQKIRQTIDQSHDEKISFIQQIQSLDVNIKNLTNQKNSLSTQLNKELQNKKVIQTDNQSLKSELMHRHQEVKNLQQQIIQLTSKVMELREQVQTSQIQAISLRQQNNIKKCEYEGIKSILCQTQEKMAQQQKLYADRANKLEEYCRKLEQEKFNLKKQLLNDSDQAMKNHVQKIKEDFDAFKSQIHKQTKFKENQLARKIDNLDTEKKSLQEQCHKKAQEKQLLELQNSQLLFKCNQIEEALKKIQIQLKMCQEQLQTAVNEVENKNNELKTNKKQLQDQIYKQQQQHKLKQNEIQQLLKFEIDKLNTEKLKINKNNQCLMERIKIGEQQRIELENRLKKKEQEIYEKDEERSREIIKLRQELKEVNLTLQEEISRYVQEIKGERQNNCRLQRSQAQRISEIQQRHINEKREYSENYHNLQKQNSKICKILTELEQENQTLKNKNQQKDILQQQIQRNHSKLQQKVQEYEQKLNIISKQLCQQKKTIETDQLKNKELLIKNQNILKRFNCQRAELEELQKKFMQEKERNQEDVRIIYEQNDKKMEEIKKQIANSYERQLKNKERNLRELAEQLNNAQRKREWQVEQVTKEYRNKETKYINQIQFKEKRITEITIQMEDLEQKFEITDNQLQSIKKKWARMYNDMGSFDSQLTNHFKTPSDYKNLKRTTKTINETTINQKQHTIDKNIQRNDTRLITTNKQFSKNQFTKMNDKDQQKKSSGTQTQNRILLSDKKKITKLLGDSSQDVVRSRIFQSSQYSHAEIDKSQRMENKKRTEFVNSQSSIGFNCESEVNSQIFPKKQ